MTEVNVFYIDDIQIDLSRSLITKNDQHIPIEPKVLRLLYFLATRENEVVTHKEIMDNVWQGMEVVPNALQRCIAVLRKSLGDDAKNPKYIKTQPRIGYALIAKVRWEQPSDTSTSQTTNATKNTHHKSNKTKAVFLTLSLLLIAIAIFLYKPAATSDKLTFTQIEQLTQTDAHESHAIYSPSASYIIFNRYAGACKSHLWAKNINSGSEHQLTSTAGYYGAPSFTHDGRDIVFSAREACDSTSLPSPSDAAAMCWSIASLDFALSIDSPQALSLRHQCQAEHLAKPLALSNHQYAFLQKNNDKYQLMHYDDLSDELSTFYAPTEHYIYHYDYDRVHDRFAVLSRNQASENVIELIDREGNIIAKEKLQIDHTMSRNQRFIANFSPDGNYLNAVSENKLYYISLNGSLQPISTPSNNLISVTMHPTEKSLLAVSGNKDTDVASLLLNTASQVQTTHVEAELNRKSLPFQSFARTNAQERHAKFQPKGDHTAFISNRSGHDQLWLWRNKQAFQLTHNKNQQPIHQFSWSPNGEKIAWISDDKIATTDLIGNISHLDSPLPLYSVLDWYGDDTILVLADDHAPSGLYLFDMSNETLMALGVNHVESAWVVGEQVFYANNKGEVYSRSLDINIEGTKALASINGKAMIIYKNSIYAVEPRSHWLNQYDLNGDFIKPVMQLKPTAWKITDMQEQSILIDQFIAINHDINVLH